MTATRRTTHSRRGRCASARLLVAALLVPLALLAFLLAPEAAAQYMFIDTNGNGMRDGGDILNAECATTLRIWLDTDSNRSGETVPCFGGGGSPTINSYMFALHVEGGTVAWLSAQNTQSGMTIGFGSTQSPTDFVMGFGGGSILPAGTYQLATVDVLPLSGSPVITFLDESPLEDELGTNFGSGCWSAVMCGDHTYRLGVQWFDTEGIGPPADTTPPSLTAPATVSAEEGSVVTFGISASDCEAIDVLDVDLSSLPPGSDAGFTRNGLNTSGTFSWRPGLNDEGIYSVAFIAGNNQTTTATTTIEVINRTVVFPYRDGDYRFLQLPPAAPYPVGVQAPEYDDSMWPTTPAPFGDTMCPGVQPVTYWITSTPMVVRKWISPGSQVTGAKLRFMVDNDATLYLNGVEVASEQHEFCPVQDDYVAVIPPGLVQPDSNLLVALCNDSGGWSAFDVTMSAVDVGPILAVAESVTVLEGDTLTLSVGVTDPEDHAIATLTADLSSLPAGHDGSFGASPENTSGTLTWTPRIGDARPEPYLVTFTAGNALTMSRTTAIRVTATDTPPVVTAPSAVAGNQGTLITFLVSAADAEGQPFDSLTADLSGLPPASGAFFARGAAADSGTFTWTPPLSAVSPTPYPVTFTAWNTLSGVASTEILVTNTDLPPEVFAPATVAGAESALVSFTVAAADPDGDPISSLSADLSGLPPVNDAVLAAEPDNLSGTFTWAPTFADGRVNPYIVTFIAANASSDSTTTSIKVDPVDRPPLLVAPAAVTGEPNVEIAFSVTTSDPDGEPVDSLVAHGVPPGGTFAASLDQLSGSFAWTPSAGDLCTKRTVTFIAANLLADTAATTITVSSASCAPVVTAPATVSSFSGTKIEVVVSALDPDGDPLTSLTADLSNLPAGNDAIFGIMAPDRSSGLLTWTPTPAVDGIFPVTFTASNLFSAAATTQIVVTSIIGPVTRRVSVSSAGAEGNASSYSGRISADGRYVVFHSNASNLVPGDTNVRSDVFRRDLITQTTELVSVDASGVQGNGASHNAFVSADGQLVVFSSTASNLVSGDANGVEDVFLRDMVAGTTERINVGPASLEANGWSFVSGMSDDGRFVAFCSDASNLVAGDANGTTDVFVRDRDTGATVLVSRNSSGTQANARCCENSAGHMSADGRFVVFPSIATNLVADDLNGRNDVFLHDRTTGTTEIISRSTEGDPSNSLSAWPAVSADGRYVAFSSFGSTLVPSDNNHTWDVFLRDRTMGTTERVTVNSSEAEANANSGYAALTAAGEAVAFHSYASNLVPSDGNGISDIFLRDRVQGTTERVSIAGTSGEATGPNAEIGVISASADGRRIVFCMGATNLVPNDLNGAVDVFVRDRQQTISTGNPEPTPRSRRALVVYPNPSDRGITISLYAPSGPAPVVRIYDVQGRLIRDLGAARTDVVPIHFAWDGRDERGRTVAAGVYFAVASDGRHPLARKVVIAR